MERANATETVWRLVEQGACDRDDVWDAIQECVDSDRLTAWVQASLRGRQRIPLCIDWECVLRRLVRWH